MRKLLFSFTYLQVDSSGFWQATIHFAQNNTTSWQHKIFHVTCSFHLLQFNLIGSLELKIPFRHYSVLSPVRNVVWLQFAFPVFYNCRHQGQYSFSHLLNPDCSIQIPGPPAVRKAKLTTKLTYCRFTCMYLSTILDNGKILGSEMSNRKSPPWGIWIFSGTSIEYFDVNVSLYKV